ncbi:MAG: MoaD/ThiS family protein, partial [Nitrospirae bacterium]|nr:MoaD/ThiS family protein [Nitrospirota bacterium]
MITIRLFGMTKMLAGNQDSLSLALTNGRRVKDLVELLDGDYPAIGALIHTKKVLVSVNQEIAHEDMEIRDGDEIALLPPFAGGSGMEPIDESQLVRVQRENFSVDR